MIDSFARIDPSLIDVRLPEHDGYPAHLAAEDTRDALQDVCGDAARSMPASWMIDPRDWPDAARDNDRFGTWGLNYIDRFTNQHSTHECTTHSLRANFEAARNRERAISYAEGPKKDFRYPESAKAGSVWLSPLSVYCEANPRQWGGANVRQVLEIAVRRGMLPETVQPAEYGFKHALHGTCGKGGMNQASGDWVSLSRLPEGWEETAKLFRPLEVIFPASYEEAVSCLLRGLVVSVGRDGHAVPYAKYMAGERLACYVDSYDVLRYDSERTMKSSWRGSFAIVTTTKPDDWSKPAS